MSQFEFDICTVFEICDSWFNIPGRTYALAYSLIQPYWYWYHVLLKLNTVSVCYSKESYYTVLKRQI